MKQFIHFHETRAEGKQCTAGCSCISQDGQEPQISRASKLMSGFSLDCFLSPVGDLVVQVCHYAQSHPHLLVGLGVVGGHLGPPG
uniref:Uncharacterized protein n=1 Tax=Anguilla anguilla TaxID=7936 RepID=A0A0E9WI77_ANGAN